MKKQIRIWGTRTFSVVLLAVAVQHWGIPLYKQYFTPKKVSIFTPTAKVRSGVFTVSFQEMGTLDAENSVPFMSEISGKIATIVPEGKEVKAGDKLVELDTTEIDKEVLSQKLNYQNALADVSRAQAELDILKESNKTEVEKAQAQLDFNKTERDRSKEQRDKKKRLADEKLVPRSDVDAAELDVRSKELAVENGEMDLALKLKEVKSKQQQKVADVDKAKFAANLAKQSLDDVLKRSKGSVIIAPCSGMLVIGEYWQDGRQKYKVGDMVQRGQMVCQLPDLSKMQIKMKVGEADAPKVHIGQPVLITLEAVPDKKFHGAVKTISALATESMFWEPGATPGRRNFEVIISVKESDPKKIKPGMTADVEFICDSIKNATFVPIEAVQEKDGKTYCFIKEGKRFERCVVKTGKRNDNFICVTKGLKKGEIVALRDPTKPVDEDGAKDSNSDEKKAEKQAAPIPEASSKKK